jgi:site-specific recombinase XerD
MQNEQLIAKYVNFLKRTSKKSDNTIKAYERDLKDVLEYIKDLSNFDESRLKEFITHLSSELLLSPKTISRKINSIRSFGKFLLRERLINENPALSIEHPESVASKPRILESTEYLKLREVCSVNPTINCIVELILQTGLKISEVSELKISNLNINGINDSFIKLDTREIPLNSKIYFVVKEYIEKNKIALNSDKPLFFTSTGKRINVRNLRGMIDDYIMRSDLSGITVNDLRNTFIFNQLQAGLPIEYVAQVVGHTSLTATHRYVELLNGEYKESGLKKLVEL